MKQKLKNSQKLIIVGLAGMPCILVSSLIRGAFPNSYLVSDIMFYSGMAAVMVGSPFINAAIWGQLGPAFKMLVDKPDDTKTSSTDRTEGSL